MRMVALLVALAVGLGAETVAVRAARMLNVRSGEMVRDAVVVVTDGKIASVGGAVPGGARVIDLGDATLLPGLIDLHTHLTFESGSAAAMNAYRYSTGEMALVGAANARKTVEAGFTTVRNLGGVEFADVALAKGIDRGWVVGPRVVASAHAIGITGGHCDDTGMRPGLTDRGYQGGVADGVDEVVKAVRYQIKHGAEVIKICATAGVLSYEASVGAQQMSVAEMKAAVDEAARHGLKVAAHAHGTEGIIAASNAGVVSIEHGTFLTDEAAEVLKKNGTWYIPNALIGVTLNTKALPQVMAVKGEKAKAGMRGGYDIAVRHGLKMAFGTDAAVIPHGENARQFRYLVEWGMTPVDAVRMATLNAAEVMGRDDLGEIAIGKWGDLIAVPGDVLKDVTALERVTFVMKGGTVVRAAPAK